MSTKFKTNKEKTEGKGLLKVRLKGKKSQEQHDDAVNASFHSKRRKGNGEEMKSRGSVAMRSSRRKTISEAKEYKTKSTHKRQETYHNKRLASVKAKKPAKRGTTGLESRTSVQVAATKDIPAAEGRKNTNGRRTRAEEKIVPRQAFKKIRTKEKAPVEGDSRSSEVLLTSRDGGEKTNHIELVPEQHSSSDTKKVVLGSHSAPHADHDGRKLSPRKPSPPTYLLWAEERQDMLEASPFFTSNSQVVKYSKGGYATSVTIEESRYMQSILWVEAISQVTFVLKRSPRFEAQLSAMIQSHKHQVPMVVFASVDKVPWIYPRKAKYVLLGTFHVINTSKGKDAAAFTMLMQRKSLDRKLPYSYSIETQESLSPSLFRGIACPSCYCALPHLVWCGWHCSECDKFYPAPPIEQQAHRLFAKMNISYSGPRMNNGKAVLDMSGGAHRQLAIWNDGIKTAHYHLPSASSEEQFYHLLSSGALESESTILLNRLLARKMPYRRSTNASLFSATFRASDVEESLTTSTLFGSHLESKAPCCIIDAVHLVNDYVARFVTEKEEELVRGFNEVSVVIPNGESLDVLEKADEKLEVSSHRAVYHMGPTVHVLIRGKESGKDVGSLEMSHGDILYIQDIHAFHSKYEMKLLPGAVSMTCVCRQVNTQSTQ